MEVLFDFYGVALSVSAKSPVFHIVLNNLKEDLNYFHVQQEKIKSGVDPTIRISILERHQPQIITQKKVFRTRMCTVYGWGRRRVCDYGGGTLVTSERSSGGCRLFEVEGYPEEIERVYEVTYLGLLSSVGEELDLLGYHRVHALGLAYKQRISALVLLPPGGGKSAMATLMHSDFSLFSDEMPLVKNGVLYPFPLRIALSPKVAEGLSIDSSRFRVFKRKVYPEKLLISIPLERIARPVELLFLLVGKTDQRCAKISIGTSFQHFVQLFLGLIVGWGLSQMSEYMLRSDNIVRIVRISLSRVKEVIILLVKARKGTFNVSKDAFENSREIESFLLERRSICESVLPQTE